MLTSIEVFSRGARNVLRLPLEPSEDPLQRNDYFVQDVVGIDPVNALISSGDYAHADGAYFNQARLDVRNIVLTLGMNPDYAERTVQYLREKLYQHFMPKVEVRLEFVDDTYVARSISGIVESLEFPIFTSDPVATISIMCFNPNFSSVEESVKSFSTTALSERTDLVYGGTTPTGVVLKIQPSVNISNIRFEVQPESGKIQKFEFKGEVLNNQALIVDTNLGKRRVELVKGSSKKSALHWLTVDSDWPQLYPGSNLVRLYSVSEVQPYTLTYTEKFGGL